MVIQIPYDLLCSFAIFLSLCISLLSHLPTYLFTEDGRNMFLQKISVPPPTRLCSVTSQTLRILFIIPAHLSAKISNFFLFLFYFSLFLCFFPFFPFSLSLCPPHPIYIYIYHSLIQCCLQLFTGTKIRAM